MRIRREDVQAVRDAANIEDVVGEQVALRPAGVGSLKGLCPFHDEKSPSFHVRPAVGLYHCFGCGEGGDVISFVQKVDLLSFAEAVERLAARVGIELRYEDDGTGGRSAGRRDGTGSRQRLIEANRAAAQFFTEQLSSSPDAAAGRQFLTDRGFDAGSAAHFGNGFAPRGGEVALKHLRGRGFTEEDLLASGLAGQGRRGLYDRFRGRLVWPIRDVTGDVVGFGARRIFDDDPIEAKYLNTPETSIYHKSQVLYGVDLAKREIARARQVVVVEGYTDVMACHLAGVETAVATCGTAFGADHIRVVRRLIGDDAQGGRVVFTFDGDAAGQKAALRAFGEDQRFVAQTFIAVARDGMDPCDLRLKHGDQAVRELVASRQPLFEFAIRSTIDQVDLNTAEGRVQALRMAAPVVAQIRDPALRPEYARQLAGWLGMEVEQVGQTVRNAARQLAQQNSAPGAAGGPAGRQSPSGQTGQLAQRPGPGQPPRMPVERDLPPAATGPAAMRPDPRDPVARSERQALECLIQVPRLVPPADADALVSDAFRVPAYRAVHDAVRAAGGMAVAVGLGGPAWVATVQEYARDDIQDLITELAVAPLPADREEGIAAHAVSSVLHMAEGAVISRIGDLRSRVQRLGPEDDGRAVLTDLLAAEAELKTLRARIHGA